MAIFNYHSNTIFPVYCNKRFIFFNTFSFSINMSNTDISSIPNGNSVKREWKWLLKIWLSIKLTTLKFKCEIKFQLKLGYQISHFSKLKSTKSVSFLYLLHVKSLSTQISFIISFNGKQAKPTSSCPGMRKHFGKAKLSEISCRKWPQMAVGIYDGSNDDDDYLGGNGWGSMMTGIRKPNH